MSDDLIEQLSGKKVSLVEKQGQVRIGQVLALTTVGSEVWIKFKPEAESSCAEWRRLSEISMIRELD